MIMALPERAQTHCTYADYFGWGSDERYELIDGVAYAMGPARVAETVGVDAGRLPAGDCHRLDARGG